tara:strand:- start:4510 stop:4737 length:228 start_codon:yes stop_codon:yes gene_type:complete
MNIGKEAVRFDDFRVIARQHRPGCWTATEDCPFSDHHDPLRMVRQAVKDNLMIMAQRKIAPGKFELLLKPAGNRR